MEANQPNPRKRRIVLGDEHRVVTATPATASTTAAPAALTRTPAQLADELRRDAWTIQGAMASWEDFSDVQLQYADSADLDAVGATLRRMATRLHEYQTSVKAQQAQELAAEEARREELKPVQIDPSSPLYVLYSAQLADGNTRLWRCPRADPTTGECRVGTIVSRPGKKATISKHVVRQHLKPTSKRDGYARAELLSDDWVA